MGLKGAIIGGVIGFVITLTPIMGMFSPEFAERLWWTIPIGMGVVGGLISKE